MKFLLHTQIGVENITAIELENKFKSKFSLDYVGYIPHKNGIVQIDWRSNTENDNFPYNDLGTIEDAFLVLDYVPNINESHDLKSIYKKLDKDKINRGIQYYFDNLAPDKAPEIRFVTRKKAAHDFRRIDLQDSIKSFFDRNVSRVQVTSKEGHKEIWTTLVKNRLIVAIRLTTKEMRQGYYKTASVEGSLRPSVAYAMAYLADVTSKSVIWDPFCGAGTIGCEISDHFKFKKLINSDISQEALVSAQENFKNLKSFKTNKGKISFRNEDFIESKSYADILITNLPFGNRYAIDENFVGDFWNKVNDIDQIKQVVILYPDLVEFAGWQLTRKFPLQILGFSAYLCVYKRR